MKTLSLDLPKMYGDHHVTEVRRILSMITGVEDIYASSAFHVVEVGYDPAKIDAEAIKAELGEAGYLDDLMVPLEDAEAVSSSDRVRPHLRHSTTYEPIQQVVSFAQDVGDPAQRTWPCPGLGVIKKMEAGDYG